MLELKLQFFGGRGGSSTKSSGNTYGSGKMTAKEFEDFTVNRMNEFDDWLNGKSKEPLELDGFTFEKYTKKDINSLISDFKYNDNQVPIDTTIAITYKDGNTLILGAGDDTKGLKTTNIDTVIWDNESTTGIYGKNARLENLIDFVDYKKGL